MITERRDKNWIQVLMISQGSVNFHDKILKERDGWNMF
jgi:hypothetical protein